MILDSEINFIKIKKYSTLIARPTQQQNAPPEIAPHSTLKYLS